MKTVVLNPDSIFEGNLILVNASHPYKNPGKDPCLSPANSEASGVVLQFRVAKLLSTVMEKIGGWEQITPVSGWRSREEQEAIYAGSLEKEGFDFTKKYVALSGHSEHETGLAIDLAVKENSIDFVRPNFPYHGICQEFREKSIAFGFVERYQRGKEAVTGIAQEPWHFRYVGFPHAEIMNKYNLALEEYVDFIKEYPYGTFCCKHDVGPVKIAVSYLKAEKAGSTYFEIGDNIPYTISGNNIDGFIIAEWRD